MEAQAWLFNRRPISPQRHNHGLMSGRAQEFDKVGAGETGGARIDEGMKVEPLMAHHRLIQDDANLARFVVDRAERRDRARPHAPDLFKQLRRAEGNAPLGADFLVHALQIDGRLFAEDEQEQAVLLVLDEQVLRMPSRDVAAQRPRVLHGMEGRMLDGGDFYRQGREVVQQVFGRGRHGAQGGVGGGLVTTPAARRKKGGTTRLEGEQTRLMRQTPIASIFRYQPNPSRKGQQMGVLIR
jgi:hypothetical protein